jgi:hypothetical protein
VRRRRAWLAAASVAGAAVVAAGTGVPLGGAAGTKSLADPAGDAGAGFDITSFAVSNDDAGTISFRVGLPAVTALPDNMALAILLDSDLDTAESNPFDYGISLIRNSAVLFPITPAGVGTAFIPRSLTTRFEPGVVHASSPAARSAGRECCSPRSGASRSRRTARPTPRPTRTSPPPRACWPTRSSCRPSCWRAPRASRRAGPPRARAFRAGVFVRDVTFGVPGDLPKGGRVTCRFTIGGQKVTAARSLTPAGRATCAGAVPPGAAGRPLRGTVTYALNGAVLKRSFAATVGG